MCLSKYLNISFLDITNKCFIRSIITIVLSFQRRRRNDFTTITYDFTTINSIISSKKEREYVIKRNM